MYSIFLNYAINFHSCVFIITLSQYCCIPLIEGPEEVKWELGLAHFLPGKLFPGNGKNNIKMGMRQMSLSMSRQSFLSLLL